MERLRASGVSPRSRREDLCGYVLKKDSPSCGLERVKVYAATAFRTKSGRGLFAATARRARFRSCRSRKKAGCRIRGCARTSSSACSRTGGFARLFAGRWNVGALVRFHTAHKLILMAHSPEAYRQLGRLVARRAGAAARELERTLHARRSWRR